MHYRPVAAAALTFALLACTAGKSGKEQAASAADTASAGQSTQATAAAREAHLSKPQKGFRLDYPSDMTAHAGFSHDYLANGAWKTFAGPDSKGQPVLELLLAGSNHITAGALRIGISKNARDIRQCTTPAKTAEPPHARQVDINGTPFTYFEAGDAAMSHYLLVHSYRAVHAGRCYAIDLLVTGTRPEVYSPPAKPPFSHKQAFERLHHALQGFHFLPVSATRQ